LILGGHAIADTDYGARGPQTKVNSQIPLPPSAENVVRDPVRKQIRFGSNDDSDALIAFFKSKLKSLGWDQNSDSRANINDDVNANLYFQQDGLGLGLEIHYVAATRRSATTISGDGLRFSPAASAPASAPATAPSGALTVKDVKGLPVPSASENLNDEAHGGTLTTSTGPWPTAMRPSDAIPKTRRST
jgi:hypothetical protein